MDRTVTHEDARRVKVTERRNDLLSRVEEGGVGETMQDVADCNEPSSHRFIYLFKASDSFLYFSKALYFSKSLGSFESMQVCRLRIFVEDQR